MSAKRSLEVGEGDPSSSGITESARSIKRTAGASPPGPEGVNPDPHPSMDLVPSALKVFNNELIMGKIAETLPAKELLTLRLNCTAWARSLAPTLKKVHTPITLNGPRPLEEYVDLMRVRVRSKQDLPFAKYRIEADGDPIEWRSNLEDFLGVVGPSITFLDLRWWLGPFFSVRDLRRLIFDQTPRLATLDLRPSRPYGYYPEDPSAQLVSHSGQTPKQRPVLGLTRLKVACPLGYSELGPALGQLVAEVIQSPALGQLVAEVIQSTFTVHGGLGFVSLKLGAGDTAQNVITPALEALNTTTNAKLRIQSLKTLKLSRVTTPELRTLVQLGQRQWGLRLQTLFMAVIPSRTSTIDERRELTTLFHEFLLTQAETLRKVYLEFFSVESDPLMEQNTLAELRGKFGPPFQIPSMERLQTLRLTRSEKMKINLEFDSNTRAFSSIRGLTYRHYPKHGLDNPAPNGIAAGANAGGPPLEQNLADDLLMFSISGVAATITDLRVSASCDNFSEFNWTLFPSVTRLQLTLTYSSGYTTQETLSQIWSLFRARAPATRLRSLHITIMFNKIQLEPINMDQFVSGVNSLIVARRLAELKAPPSFKDLRALANQYKPEARPSILDLEHLEELTVVTEAWVATREGLTDVGAYLGLALAAGATGSRLKKVEIYGAPGVHMENHISDQCREYLGGVMGPDAVINI